MFFQTAIRCAGVSQKYPEISFIYVPVYSRSIDIAGTEIELRFWLTLLSSFEHPCGGLSVILRHTFAVVIEESQPVLCFSQSLYSSLAIPICGLGIVLRNACALVVHYSQIQLSDSIALVGSLAIPGTGLRHIFRY